MPVGGVSVISFFLPNLARRFLNKSIRSHLLAGGELAARYLRGRLANWRVETDFGILWGATNRSPFRETALRALIQWGDGAALFP